MDQLNQLRLTNRYAAMRAELKSPMHLLLKYVNAYSCCNALKPSRQQSAERYRQAVKVQWTKTENDREKFSNNLIK